MSRGAEILQLFSGQQVGGQDLRLGPEAIQSAQNDPRHRNTREIQT